MPTFFAVAIKYWYLIAIAVLLGWIGLQHLDIADYKVTIAEQKTSIDALTTANKTFAATVADQTASITALQAAQARAAALYKAALAKANAAQKLRDNEIAHIQAEPVTGDHCVFVHTMFTQYIKERRP